MPIQTTPKIWMNGELVAWADAQIHVLTHTLHYGTGVFEGIRAYETADGPAVFRLTEHIQRLQSSLAAAFTAKTAAISAERLNELMTRLETLEELLPDALDVDIDESLVLDLSGHESAELEVVGEGGSMPTPAMRFSSSTMTTSWPCFLRDSDSVRPILPPPIMTMRLPGLTLPLATSSASTSFSCPSMWR